MNTSTTGNNTSLFRRLFTARGKQHRSDSSLTVAPGVIESESQEGVTLLHVATGRVFSCNGTGLRIWREVRKGARPHDIAEGLSQSFGLPAQQAHSDTTAFLATLERNGLVTRA